MSVSLDKQRSALLAYLDTQPHPLHRGAYWYWSWNHARRLSESAEWHGGLGEWGNRRARELDREARDIRCAVLAVAYASVRPGVGVSSGTNARMGLPIYIVIAAFMLLSGCVEHQRAPWGPRGAAHPAQDVLVDVWHERGHPRCDQKPDYIGLTAYEAKHWCGGVYSCYRYGDVYALINHASLGTVLQYRTVHWLLECTGQPPDPQEERRELWTDLLREARKRYYEQYPPMRCGS